MIRKTNKTFRAVQRWIRQHKKGRFSQSTLLTLITRPVWQHERIRAWMGAPLVAAVIAGASVSNVASADALSEWKVGDPTSNIPGITEMQTDHTYILPVASLTGISQYFRAGHPGIDFRAPNGSAVVAMDNGTVSSIVESRTGYGRHVYITHENGYVTLYAHLGLIMVELNESIKAGDKVGEIGMTGWTTGPHLHFELTQNGAKLNPMSVLSKAVKNYGSVAAK